ncbi:Rho termination factor N-terminal domain-containing protein, partial [Streptomyces sp. KLMMK]|uniref:Rho termination factor N-terminal domain-containing protein n=1 Tax=Streptomyces sp. KLMMK TaxID=3109353 RepID=UPI00300BD8F4
MSDTTDLMGVNAGATGNASAPATDAPAAPATGAATAPKRRRSGTGLDAMVLAELQQLASSLGIKGTARMRKGQLIEVIKERQAGSSAAPAKAAAAAPAADAETKPKRRATSKARTGEAAEKAEAKPAEKAAAQQQIEIPGQPGSDEQPAAERRRRRATAPAGSPEGTEVKTEARAEERTEAKAETALDTAEGKAAKGDRQDRGE